MAQSGRYHLELREIIYLREGEKKKGNLYAKKLIHVDTRRELVMSDVAHCLGDLIAEIQQGLWKKPPLGLASGEINACN
jgi:hypothetical protein